MPYIQVVCAIICNKNGILICKRSATMSNPYLWEFPGGKIKPDETVFDAIKRECMEELQLEIIPKKHGKSVFHSYPHIEIELIPILCTAVSESISLKEHMHFEYVMPDELVKYRLSMADLKLLEENSFFKVWFQSEHNQ